MRELVSRNATLADKMSGLQTSKRDLGRLVRLGLVAHERTGARREGKLLDTRRLTRLLNVELLVAVLVANTFKRGVHFATCGRQHLEVTDEDRLCVALKHRYLSLFERDGLSKIVVVEHSRQDRGRGTAGGNKSREGNRRAETHFSHEPCPCRMRQVLGGADGLLQKRGDAETESEGRFRTKSSYIDGVDVRCGLPEKARLRNSDL